MIIFVNPSPNWKAITVACLDNPITSEKGAMMGMVRAALAEPDGMMMLIMVWIKYMIPSESTRPASLIKLASE